MPKKTWSAVAGLAAAGAAAIMFAGPANAAPTTAVCNTPTISADGHSASVTCTSGTGYAYGLRANACNVGGCRIITSGPTAYGTKTTVNAGSAYIDNGTPPTIISYVH